MGVWTKDGVKDLGDTSYRDRPYDYGSPYHLPNHPVVGIIWYEALAFTRWLTDRWLKNGAISRNWRVCLPSEAEWEKGARGGVKIPKSPVLSCSSSIVVKNLSEEELDNLDKQRGYPWGNKINKNRVNYNESGVDATNAVGVFPTGKSPYGCEEMSGNVWEWTRSLWGKDILKSEFCYPYRPEDGREALYADKNMLRVLRGGSFASLHRGVRCSCRGGGNPSGRADFIGFRVVLSPRSPTSDL